MEESNADKAIKALAAALAPKAKVKRNGKFLSLDASELVPGDIVIVSIGNIVPADVKLLGEMGDHDTPLQVCFACFVSRTAKQPESKVASTCSSF